MNCPSCNIQLPVELQAIAAGEEHHFSCGCGAWFKLINGAVSPYTPDSLDMMLDAYVRRRLEPVVMPAHARNARWN